MTRFEFAQNFIYLKDRKIDFAGREYLEAVYNSTAQRMVIRAARQVEKSTFLVNAILYDAMKTPGLTTLFVAPRDQQASVFVKTRLIPTIQNSPVVARALLGARRRKLGVKDLQFANGSTLHVRAAYHSADAVRGLSADILMIDEFQDIADGDLPVLMETLSHSATARVILTGTPKLVDNHLEGAFQRSTGCEWAIPCANCGRDVMISERALGSEGLICPDCQLAIDPRQGRWFARRPLAAWGAGFCISHPMVSWLRYREILHKQQAYDPIKFKNECLGQPTTLGEHIVTREEVEACCSQRPMASSAQDVPPPWRGKLLAGVDWGGGAKARTILTIGYMRPENIFEVCHFSGFAAREEPDYLLSQIAGICSRFGVRAVGVDGGGAGFHLNRLLANRLGLQLYAVLYAQSDSAPRQDGLLWQWSVHRTASIGLLFARIKLKKISFPRVEDCGSYLDEITCEVAEYDDHHRSIKYVHPATQPDDALHATNYALLMGVRSLGHTRHSHDQMDFV